VSSKINDLTTSVTNGRTSGTVAPSRDTSTGVAASTTESATGDVHITDTATTLAGLEQALRDSPAVDSARVAILQSAIEQGGYTVQPEHIASQLLQMEQVLRGVPDGRPAVTEE
jgi:negative regulator of flagellin synthesis FlgM